MDAFARSRRSCNVHFSKVAGDGEWHSARSGPEVVMITTCQCPRLTDCLLYPFSLSAFSLCFPQLGQRACVLPRWRPSRRACSGEGLAAAGILVQQQDA